MADTKISALTAETVPAGTDEIPVNQSGTTKKLTLAQVNSYAEPISNGSVANQTLGTGDTYVTGSGLTVPVSRIQVGTFYRCVFNIVKTAAGVAAPVVTVRMGTAGTTADLATAALTFAAQTGVIDEGQMEILANFRFIGISAGIQGFGKLSHRLLTTGLNVTATNTLVVNTSGGQNLSAITKIGVSVNAGAASAWTLSLVQADLLNIT